eukprot:Phypoly_transcript_03196.p1 GENE.Phypoly_transcript_03196~~Phypoly_transcript_03196.p1  ORF type:complete len:812 (+),score=220.62 Phypoly_transcript_03196:71-2437(+)
MAAAAAASELIGSLVQRYYQGVKVFPGELTQSKLRELMKFSSGRKGPDVLMKIAEAHGWAHDAELHNLFISKFPSQGIYRTKMAVHKMRESKLVPGREAYLSLGVAMGLETGRWKDVVEYLRLRGVLGEKEWATLISEATSTESLGLYNIMKDRKVTPTVDVFHGLMQAHARKTQVELDSTSPYTLKGIFDEMRRTGVEPTEKTYELLTTLRHVDTLIIKKMYYGMKNRGLTPTITTYTHWIEQFGAENNWEWSGRLWEEVRGRLDEFETEDLTRVLQTFSANPDPAVAIQILDTVVKKNLIEGAKGYNYILLSLAKQGDAKSCEKYFLRMQRDQHAPTTETYEYMMQANVIANNPAKVIQYDKEMRAHGFAPTRNAYRYLLAAHARTSDSRAVDRVLGLMAQDHIKIEVEDYHILMQNAPTSILVQRWYQAIKSKPNFPIKPDTPAIALHAFARTKDDKAAMAIYNEMTQEERTAHHAYDAVLRACCAANSHVIFCKSVLNDARNSHAELEKETYDALVEFFGKNGDKNQVLALASEMSEKGHEMSASARKATENAGKGSLLLDSLLEEVGESQKGNKKEGKGDIEGEIGERKKADEKGKGGLLDSLLEEVGESKKENKKEGKTKENIKVDNVEEIGEIKKESKKEGKTIESIKVDKVEEIRESKKGNKKEGKTKGGLETSAEESKGKKEKVEKVEEKEESVENAEAVLGSLLEEVRTKAQKGEKKEDKVREIKREVKGEERQNKTEKTDATDILDSLLEEVSLEAKKIKQKQEEGKEIEDKRKVKS